MVRQGNFLGKYEVSLGKVTFSSVIDFTSGKYAQVNFRDEVIVKIIHDAPRKTNGGLKVRSVSPLDTPTK